ncbi:E3 ubiquitin-protein ligase Ubr3-like [Uranotaenia lowii]|uniref:E3 ubiquitin-protein ligase Ubr3-like n=1 Tax=Uranotaenia lowii TaxID=190385 RepID=UPI00247AE950|nr:E3 ubiquitin-protein ligase Ubr3-like [Uranotaenia lowii]
MESKYPPGGSSSSSRGDARPGSSGIFRRVSINATDDEGDHQSPAHQRGSSGTSGGSTTSLSRLKDKGKKLASAQVQRELAVLGESESLNLLLDEYLNPMLRITCTTSIEWCKWLIAGGRSPAEFASIVRSYDNHAKCGLVWVPHVVAYRCRTCGISPCMSICRDCFKRGNHTGHDFNMFLSLAGGACDCGDTSVMKAEGFCSDHGINNCQNKSQVPNDLMIVAEAMMPRLLLRLLLRFRNHNSRNHNSTMRLHTAKNCDDYCSMLMEFNNMGELMRRVMTKVLIDEDTYRRLTEPPFPSNEYGLCLEQSRKNYEEAVRMFPSPEPPDEYKHLPALGETIVHKTLLEEFIFWTFMYEFPQNIVCFLLNMLPDQDYKEHLTRTFVMHYCRIPSVLEMSSDPDTLSNRVVHMSVQLFSNESLALKMVEELSLLHVMIISLKQMMSKILTPNTLHDPDKNFHYVIDCAKRVMKDHCYWPLASDFNNVLSHESVALVFLKDDNLIDMWFQFLSMLQGMNVNIRETGSHVEFEPSSYYAAFSCELEASAYPMWSIISHLKDPTHAPLAKKIMMFCVNYLQDWLDAVNFYHHPKFDKDELYRASFHFPLHRYLAAFICQGVKKMGMSLSEILPSPDLLPMLMMHPLRVQVSGCFFFLNTIERQRPRCCDKGGVIDLSPRKQLALLHNQMDDSILLHKPQTDFNEQHSLIVGHVRNRLPHVDVTIGLGAGVVAQAEAVAAMPEQPPPPGIDLGGAAALQQPGQLDEGFALLLLGPFRITAPVLAASLLHNPLKQHLSPKHPGELHHRVALQLGDRDRIVQLVQHLLGGHSEAADRRFGFLLLLSMSSFKVDHGKEIETCRLEMHANAINNESNELQPLADHDRVDLLQGGIHRKPRITEHRIGDVDAGQLKVRIVHRDRAFVLHELTHRVEQLVHIDQVLLQQLPLVKPFQDEVIVLIISVVRSQIIAGEPSIDIHNLLQDNTPLQIPIILLLIFNLIDLIDDRPGSVFQFEVPMPQCSLKKDTKKSFKLMNLIKENKRPPTTTKFYEAMGRAMENMTSCTQRNIKNHPVILQSLFSFVISIARINLESEVIQRGGTLCTQRDLRYKPKRDCIVPLLHVLSLHVRLMIHDDSPIRFKFGDEWPAWRSWATLAGIQLASNQAGGGQDGLGMSSTIATTATAMIGAALGLSSSDLWEDGSNASSTAAVGPTSGAAGTETIPALLNDPCALMLKFILLAPLQLDQVYFTCIVKVMYNLLYYQIVLQLCTQLSDEECDQIVEKYYAQKERGSVTNLGVAMLFVLQNLDGGRNLRSDSVLMTNGGGGSTESGSPANKPLDMVALEKQLQTLCLPFLRVAALLRHHIYHSEIPDIPGPQWEFSRLIYYLELVTVSMDLDKFNGSRALCFLPGTELALPKFWCDQLRDIRPSYESARSLIVNQHIQWQQPRLLRLPREYERLFTYYHEQPCLKCLNVPKESSICLLCGTIVCLKQLCCKDQECCEAVRHSISCGGGTGIFLVVTSTYIIVIRGRRACLWGSLYLDDYDEEDRDLKRGKPLYLSEDRFNLLESQWLSHRFAHTKHTWVWHRDSL